MCEPVFSRCFTSVNTENCTSCCFVVKFQRLNKRFVNRSCWTVVRGSVWQLLSSSWCRNSEHVSLRRQSRDFFRTLIKSFLLRLRLLLLQKRSEGGPGADAGGVQGVQEDQGQTPPPGSSHQQTGFLQIHLDLLRYQLSPRTSALITAARTRRGRHHILGGFNKRSCRHEQSPASRRDAQSHLTNTSSVVLLHSCHGEKTKLKWLAGSELQYASENWTLMPWFNFYLTFSHSERDFCSIQSDTTTVLCLIHDTSDEF